LLFSLRQYVLSNILPICFYGSRAEDVCVVPYFGLQFRNVELKDKAREYDNAVKKFMLRQEINLVNAGSINEYLKLFDVEIITVMSKAVESASSGEFIKKDYSLLTKDPLAIRQLLGFYRFRRRNWQLRIKDNITPLLSKVRELIALLKKEYRLK